MRLDANTYITNRCWKDKIGAVTCKGRHGLIWENLDGRMELLGYLKVILLIGINLVEFGRTKENQTRSHI